MFKCYELIGKCRNELNTEMRFIFASAKVDGEELVRLEFQREENDKENDRIEGCIIKVLRRLKKEGIIQFYVNKDGFDANSTEATYLLNKYGEYINGSGEYSGFVYAKI